MLFRVADEPVVVMKFPPMKPGNGAEEKTETTCSKVYRDCREPKATAIAKGRSLSKSLGSHCAEHVGNKLPDEAGKYRVVPLGKGL